MDATDAPATTRRQPLVVAAVIAVAVPGLLLRITGVHPTPWVAALAYGFAVVSAAFLLAWAAEVIQLDISAGLALALLALIAVLPEYAVDFVFTWKAGKDPGKYAGLALANMTGGNQLLIGVGWSLVVLLAVWRAGKLRSSGRVEAHHEMIGNEVRLERTHSVEISFLVLATVYGLTLPLRRTLTLFDAAVLVTIFLAYVVRIARAPAEEPHLVGPAAWIGTFSVSRRRAVTAVLFVCAAGVILLCAEHFASALVETGSQFGISEFLLVKWLAPLASEAPELLVAAMFAWRLNANSGLGALVSSKVNQWTLLVGTLPIVYAISSSTHHGLPIDALQREELFVTAAQSTFALAVLASRSMSKREAQALLSLFVVQFVLQGVLHGDAEQVTRIGVGIIYLVGAAVLIFRERRTIPTLLHDGLRKPYAELVVDDFTA